MLKYTCQYYIISMSLLLDKILKINIPDKILNLNEQDKLNIYYEELKNHTSEEILLEKLNYFYDSLNNKTKKILYFWYKYNVTIVAPNLAASTELTHISIKSDFDYTKIYISDDGLNFCIDFDDQDENERSKIQEFLQMLEKSHPKLKYNKN